MHMQTTDPTNDHAAFIGGALGCALLLGSLLLADKLPGPSHEAPAMTSSATHSLSSIRIGPRSTVRQNP